MAKAIRILRELTKCFLCLMIGMNLGYNTNNFGLWVAIIMVLCVTCLLGEIILEKSKYYMDMEHKDDEHREE